MGYMLEENDTLKAQLKIAMEALELVMRNGKNERNSRSIERTVDVELAREALEKIHALGETK